MSGISGDGRINKTFKKQEKRRVTKGEAVGPARSGAALAVYSTLPSPAPEPAPAPACPPAPLVQPATTAAIRDERLSRAPECVSFIFSKNYFVPSNFLRPTYVCCLRCPLSRPSAPGLDEKPREKGEILSKKPPLSLCRKGSPLTRPQRFPPPPLPPRPRWAPPSDRSP